VPWWASLAWCAAFLALALHPRAGVVLAALIMPTRILAVLTSVGTVSMLTGLGFYSVMAFYAMTALWPALLALLWRGRGTTLSRWMLPLAALEGAGAISALAGILSTALLGTPRFGLRPLSAAAFTIAQIFFLLRTARTS
jgi:hypothetical protein